jgi:hypothetical protein
MADALAQIVEQAGGRGAADEMAKVLADFDLRRCPGSSARG